MPATFITPNTITDAGLVPPAEAAADNVNGNSVINSGNIWLEFTNTTAVATTVTVTFPGKVRGQSIASKVYNFAATAGLKLRVGPFDPAAYGSTLNFTASAATVTVAAYQWSP